MILLVSNQQSLFRSNKYRVVEFEYAMSFLYPMRIVQLDTETSGLDCFTKKLLTIQLGNKDVQVVFDWDSLTLAQIKVLKEYLESDDRVFLGWNLLFDLRFLYVNDIWPNNLWDGMLAEKLLYLGFPAGIHEMSLKAAAWNYLQYDLDKSVRGKIINVGLTEEVVVYAAGDVMHLEDIKNAQEVEIKKKELEKAVQFENIFLKCLAYIEICGVKLDIPRWKRKIEADRAKMVEAENALNEWTVNWCLEHPKEAGGRVYNYIEVYNKNNLKPFEIQAIQGLLNQGFVRDMSEDAEGDFGLQKMCFVKATDCAFISVDFQGNLFTGFNTKPKCTINWGSSKQVIKFLKLLGFNLKTFDKATKKEKESVDAKIIKSQLDVSPIAEIYLKYTEARKVVSTYGDNWIKAINPVSGRIHPDYYQLGTDTGRLSCGGGLTGVNVQNIPHDKETRACFIASKGYKWISADYQG